MTPLPADNAELAPLRKLPAPRRVTVRQRRKPAVLLFMALTFVAIEGLAVAPAAMPASPVLPQVAGSPKEFVEGATAVTSGSPESPAPTDGDIAPGSASAAPAATETPGASGSGSTTTRGKTGGAKRTVAPGSTPAPGSTGSASSGPTDGPTLAPTDTPTDTPAPIPTDTPAPTDTPVPPAP